MSICAFSYMMLNANVYLITYKLVSVIYVYLIKVWIDLANWFSVNVHMILVCLWLTKLQKLTVCMFTLRFIDFGRWVMSSGIVGGAYHTIDCFGIY